MEQTPPQQNTDQSETPQQPEEVVHRAHTYQDDLSRAMNATDANVVQELIALAREKEEAERQYKKSIGQRKLYSFFSIVFLIIAAGAIGYSIYHYNSLTVPVEESVSVGVFPSTDPIVTSTTDIRQTLATLRAAQLKEGKPSLVPLVGDEATLTPLSKSDFFSFIEATPTEPFSATMDIVRLGMLNEGFTTTPFIILSVRDPQIASKEFLIAEPKLIQLFYRALDIDPGTLTLEAGSSFESTYLYNLPVRMLRTPAPEGGEGTPIILYGYATNNIVVITTKPSVLKAVYDTIAKQH